MLSADQDDQQFDKILSEKQTHFSDFSSVFAQKYGQTSQLNFYLDRFIELLVQNQMIRKFSSTIAYLHRQKTAKKPNYQSHLSNRQNTFKRRLLAYPQIKRLVNFMSQQSQENHQIYIDIISEHLDAIDLDSDETYGLLLLLIKDN